MGSFLLILPWTTSPSEPFQARLASGCGSHLVRTISSSPRLRLRLAPRPNHFKLASPPAAARTSSEPFQARLASGCGSHYHRIRFSSSTERRRRKRKIDTMIASPTATSAAATHITKNTRACPSAVPCRCPRATSARLAALSISSMDMKMTSGLRRISTPSTPMLNSTADSATYQDSGTILLALHLPLRQRHHADDGHEQEHGGDLEREEVVGEQEPPQRLHAALYRDVRSGPAQHRGPQDQRHQDEEHADQRYRHPPLAAERVRPRLLLARDQDHDGEDEQHGDGSRVHDDLGRGQELRPQGEEEPGHAPQVHHQEERPVNGVPPEEEPRRRAHHQHRQDHEGDHAHEGLMSGGMGTGEVGVPSGPAGSSARSASFV